MRRFLNIALIVLSVSITVMASEDISINEFKDVSIKFGNVKTPLKLRMKEANISNEDGSYHINYESEFGGCLATYSLSLSKSDKRFNELSGHLDRAIVSKQPIDLSPATVWKINSAVGNIDQDKSQVNLTLNSKDGKTVLIKCQHESNSISDPAKWALDTYKKLFKSGIRFQKNGKEFKPYSEQELKGAPEQVSETPEIFEPINPDNWRRQ
jgi:hypothetical protein